MTCLRPEVSICFVYPSVGQHGFGADPNGLRRSIHRRRIIMEWVTNMLTVFLRQVIWRMTPRSIAKRVSFTSPSPRCSKWSLRDLQSVSFSTLMLSFARTCHRASEGECSCKSPSKTLRRCSASCYPANINNDSACRVERQTRQITELLHSIRAIGPPLFCMKSGPQRARRRPD